MLSASNADGPNGLIESLIMASVKATRSMSPSTEGPLATRMRDCPGGAVKNVEYRRVTSEAKSPRILPPQPHTSLPMPKYFTVQGGSRPLRRRSSASVDFSDEVIYS